VTAGYLFKLHPRLTNCTTLKELLLKELSDVVIDPELACTLDPSLKEQYTEAMSNGDFFSPAIPRLKSIQLISLMDVIKIK